MREPLVCVTVTGRTMEELRRARDAAEGADLVEVRLDSVDRPSAAGALDGRLRPVIVTCRPSWEGGHFTGSEEERRVILEEACASGAEFVDVEARASFAPCIIRSRRGRGVVLSMHAFGEAMPDVPESAAAMRSSGAEVIKIAVEVQRLSDLIPLFDAAKACESDPVACGHVLVGMGATGVPSRVLAARLGNRWTYAGAGVAPGQLPARTLLREYRFRRIRADAALYGVVGSPVGQSRSPAMHNAGFAALGLNAVYVPFETADAEDFVGYARHVGLRGASITAPLKVALMRHVDDVDPLARRVGAINTLVVRDGRWIGANTDVAGFLAPLAGRIALKGVRAAVIGAGGAARAVAIALADRGAHVTICARRAEGAGEIAAVTGAAIGELPPRPGSWDVLVNATPLGSAADPRSPMAGASLDGEIVFDLVYAPAETRLLADARGAGCLTIGGLEMLVAQAERQFELWTGQRPPAGLFQAAAFGSAESEGPAADETGT